MRMVSVNFAYIFKGIENKVLTFCDITTILRVPWQAFKSKLIRFPIFEMQDCLKL